MRIDQYYANIGRMNLNGSIAALVPVSFIIGGNLLLLHNKIIILFSIPFILYSLIGFQMYVFRIRQSIFIRKNLLESNYLYESIFDTERLLVLFYNSLSPQVLLFFPNGHAAGVIKRQRDGRRGFLGREKIYCLYNGNKELISYYKIKGKKKLKIEVYDNTNEYVGCMEQKKDSKVKKELLDQDGRFLCAVEGSSFYMDEHVIDSRNHVLGRLRRGWMPLEWSSYFPEANTPVLQMDRSLGDQDKILQMAMLVHEFFWER